MLKANFLSTQKEKCPRTQRNQFISSNCLSPYLNVCTLCILLFLFFNRANQLHYFASIYQTLGLPGGSVLKNPPTNVGDAGLISGSRRSSGGGNSNPLQYSWLGNPMDRGTWQATVQGAAKSHAWPSKHTTTTKHLCSFITF